MAGLLEKSIKHFIGQGCYQLGLFKLLFSLNKDAVIVFMLHAVTDDECNSSSPWQPLWKRVHTDELETAIAALKPYVDFIDMDEAARRLAGEVKASRPGVAFTFDDGYSNNVSHAYPVLRRHQVPMMIYFATGFTSTKKLFWIDEFDYLLQMQSTPQFSVKLEQKTFYFDTSSRDRLRADYKCFRQSLREMYPDEREVLAQLDLAKQQLDPTGELLSGDILQNPLLRILSDEEIVALPEGIDVGCHTVNHLRIGELGRDVIDPEIRDAKIQPKGTSCYYYLTC